MIRVSLNLIRFRQAIAADAEVLFDLHVRSVRSLCSEVYPTETINAWFGDRDATFYIDPIRKGKVYVAELEGAPIGFIEINPGEVTNLFVAPEFSGHGVGTLLLREGLKRVFADGSEEVFIEATLNSVPFYLKHGFTVMERGEWVSPSGTISIPVVFMKLRKQT